MLLSIFLTILTFTSISCVSAAQQLKILSPDGLISGFSNALVPTSPALFGVPDYRTAYRGQVYYGVDKGADTHYGCLDDGIDANKTGFPKDKADDPQSLKILLLDRGGECTFTKKVRNAQKIPGIVAVIHVDNKPEYRLPIMADDGTGSDIYVPSVLISMDDGAKLRKAVEDAQHDKDPQKQKENAVFVALSFQIPNPDNRVEIDFWTSSWDPNGVNFKQRFAPVVQALGKHALFTPHYYVLPGEFFGCDLPPYTCANQCFNNGHYCTWDPDHDLSQGLSGRDVLSEDLRRASMYQYINETYSDMAHHYLWFDYVNKFEKECVSGDAPKYEKWKSGECSWDVMSNLGMDVDKIKQIMKDSGELKEEFKGDEKENWKNKIFETERKNLDLYGGAIIKIPWVIVNDKPIYGGLDCPQPLSQATCAPLSAVCQGFKEGTAPEACTDANFDWECAYTGFLPHQPDNMCHHYPSGGSSGLTRWQIFWIIVLVLLACGCIGAVVYWYMKREQQIMRDDIDSLLKQYLPLDGTDRGENGHLRSTQRLVDSQEDDDRV